MQETLDGDIPRLKSENESFQHEIESLIKKLTVNKQIEDDLLDQKRSLEEQIENLTKDVQNLKTENIKLSSKIENYIDDEKEWSSEKDSLEKNR
eukprot:UN20825